MDICYLTRFTKLKEVSVFKLATGEILAGSFIKLEELFLNLVLIFHFKIFPHLAIVSSNSWKQKSLVEI